MQLGDAIRKYDAASKHYDRFMDVVFGSLLDVERHRERVIALLGDIEGGTVVDVGCGTGRNFPSLVRAVGTRGRIIGVDCSAGMLERARQRVRRHGWRNVELMHGDAVRLESIREPVDAVVSVWCYGTVYDLAGALNRAVDVLHPGGRLALMTFMRASPSSGPLRWLYPLSRFAVRCAGIDPAEDFDNAALERKWKRGRELLRGLLCDVQEETYLQGAGLIVAGRKPVETADAAGAADAREASAHDLSDNESAGAPAEPLAPVPIPSRPPYPGRARQPSRA